MINKIAYGLFTISINNPVATDTTVTFTVTGTASNGVDTVLIPVTAVIPAGQTSVTVPLIITDDTIVELTETLKKARPKWTGFTGHQWCGWFVAITASRR